MKTWTKPSFREIQMNAEIGSYQPDEGGIDRITPSELERQSVQSRSAASSLVVPQTA
jgi:hypothetical protein